LRRLANGHLRNVRFDEFISLVIAFGFKLERTKGSHQLYVHPYAEDALILQPMDGEAKPYQIRQFLELIDKYSLCLEEEH